MKPRSAERLIDNGGFEIEEVQLASRNPGMPLEGLAYPVTPTGMHYQLTHFDIPTPPSNWQLSIGGLVDEPVTLSLEDLQKRPTTTTTVTMECAGNGRALMNPRYASRPWLQDAVGTAQWTGTPLAGVLQDAGLKDTAVELVFSSFDQGVQGGDVLPFQRSLSVAEALREEVLLAWAMNDEALQPQHGYPLRLIVPGWYGMTSVKWLADIDAVAEPFRGYQMTHSYRYVQQAGEEGTPVSLIRVRSLMIPPGVSDFYSRKRLLKPGRIELQGRAWSGRAAISRVEISSDDGQRWYDAELQSPASPFAWTGWRYTWGAAPGSYVLCVRATDTNGDQQPLEHYWTRQGMGNNSVQRVPVLVTPDSAESR